MILGDHKDHNYTFNLIMESSVMNIHDFAGSNLIFTMTTGKHVYLINVVHRLILFYIITTIVKLYFYNMYFLRDLVKIGLCHWFEKGCNNPIYTTSSIE